MKDIEQTDLKFFGDYFLPLTKQVSAFARKFSFAAYCLRECGMRAVPVWVACVRRAHGVRAGCARADVLRAFVACGRVICAYEYFTEQAESMGRLVEAKNKRILHDQIWDLFPSFCDLPTDLPQVNSLLNPFKFDFFLKF